MYIYGRINVMPEQSPVLNSLKEIAYNTWWTWNYEYIHLLKDIDNDLFIQCNNNPIDFLNTINKNKLTHRLSNQELSTKYNSVLEQYNKYVNTNNTWFKKKYEELGNFNIAYFSAEYGLHESIPIYSGGLGILSGDHCKSASDIGLPFTAIGLLYKQGYFNQYINANGWPENTEQKLDISKTPITPIKDADDKEILISVEFPNREVFIKIWRITVGRINLYLLDTDIEQNLFNDRKITSQLYGGDQETRITQEMILGIGGIRALKALNINPSVYHINEGHSAFICLELLKDFMKKEHLTFQQAKEAVKSSVVFTTHTPVPAGSDLFSTHLVDKYFSDYIKSTGIDRRELLEFGLTLGWNGKEVFNMTLLALKLSGKKNGVSKLHGMVSRNIFNYVWHGIPEEEVPIEHITNGIHTHTWISHTLNRLFKMYLGADWINNNNTDSIWVAIDSIPAQELWFSHLQSKSEMIDFLNAKLDKSIHNKAIKLNPHALIIGFARRFATYKRANLIFNNLDRITSLLNNTDYPVQIIFSGKAHPADIPGNRLIKAIIDYAKSINLEGKIFFIENYDIEIARYLVQGVDIWLNNPRKPLEASGTSGQKAALNGIPNLSISDGWWEEGYNGKNGWVIGDDNYHSDSEHQDFVDSETLYSLLETKVIPLYFHRNSQGTPESWVQLMKESIKSSGYLFSTSRMLIDYTTKMYIPTSERYKRIQQNDYKELKNITEWKTHIISNWSKVNIYPIQSLKQTNYNIKPGDTVHLECMVDSGNIEPSNLKVEAYYGLLERIDLICESYIEEMQLIEQMDTGKYKYSTDISFEHQGEYGFTFRVTPFNTNLINRHATGLIKWAE